MRERVYEYVFVFVFYTPYGELEVLIHHYSTSLSMKICLFSMRFSQIQWHNISSFAAFPKDLWYGLNLVVAIPHTNTQYRAYKLYSMWMWMYMYQQLYNFIDGWFARLITNVTNNLSVCECNAILSINAY